MLIWQDKGIVVILPGLLIAGLIALAQAAATPLGETLSAGIGVLLGSLVEAVGLWWLEVFLMGAGLEGGDQVLGEGVC